jgi:LacI family transcriptional regulator
VAAPHSHQPRHRATLRSIAEEAGVSTATVSLILNNREDAVGLSPATARKVRRIAEKQHYVPNIMARNLRSRTNRALGIFWPLASPDEQPFASSLMQGLHQRGYAAHFMDSSDSTEEVQTALRHFLGNRVDGVVLYLRLGQMPRREMEAIGKQLALFSSSVLVSRDRVESWPGDFVYHDDTVALNEICHHFHRAGRSLAVLGQTGGSPRKNQSVKDAWQACGGRPADLSFIDITPFGTSAQINAIAQALTEARRPKKKFDAILCYNDQTAAAVMEVLKSEGGRVPEDVAVCGFTNDPVSPFLTPPLASVNRHAADLAPTVLDLLFSRLKNPTLPPRSVAVPMTFIPRASAG